MNPLCVIKFLCCAIASCALLLLAVYSIAAADDTNQDQHETAESARSPLDTEALLLIWNGPMLTYGATPYEDPSSTLSFLSGLWYHVLDRGDNQTQEAALELQRLMRSSSSFTAREREEYEALQRLHSLHISAVRVPPLLEPREGNSALLQQQQQQQQQQYQRRRQHSQSHEDDNNNEEKFNVYDVSPQFHTAVRYWLDATLTHLAVPVSRRAGERQAVAHLENAHEKWDELRGTAKADDQTGHGGDNKNRNTNNDAENAGSKQDSDGAETARRTRRKNFQVKFVGAINHAVGFQRDGNLLEDRLPPSHVAEFAASVRGVAQTSLALPSLPVAWFGTQPDPSRTVVVCQSLSPAQWSLPFPKSPALMAALCPPVRGAALARVGRVLFFPPREPHDHHPDPATAATESAESAAPPSPTDETNEKSNDKLLNFVLGHLNVASAATSSCGVRCWKRRLSAMDQIWVPSAAHEKDLVERIGVPREIVKVVLEPIDTELWRPRTLVGNSRSGGNDEEEEEEEEKVQEKELKMMAAAAAVERTTSRLEAVNRRNVEILQRTGMIPSEWAQQQLRRTYSSSSNSKKKNNPRSLTKILNSGNDGVSFDVPVAEKKAGGNRDDDELYCRQKQQLLEECTRRPEAATNEKARIAFASFDWTPTSGWDVLLLEYFDKFYSSSSSPSSSSSSSQSSSSATQPCLLLQTIRRQHIYGEDQILDFKSTVDLFLELLLSPISVLAANVGIIVSAPDGATNTAAIFSSSREREIEEATIAQQERLQLQFLQDQVLERRKYLREIHDELDAIDDERDRAQRAAEVRFEEEMLLRNSPYRFVDRSVAARLAVWHRREHRGQQQSGRLEALQLKLKPLLDQLLLQKKNGKSKVAAAATTSSSTASKPKQIGDTSAPVPLVPLPRVLLASFDDLDVKVKQDLFAASSVAVDFTRAVDPTMPTPSASGRYDAESSSQRQQLNTHRRFVLESMAMAVPVATTARQLRELLVNATSAQLQEMGRALRSEAVKKHDVGVVGKIALNLVNELAEQNFYSDKRT